MNLYIHNSELCADCMTNAISQPVRVTEHLCADCLLRAEKALKDVFLKRGDLLHKGMILRHQRNARKQRPIGNES